MQTAAAFSLQESHQEGTWHLCSLRRHRTPNTWGAWERVWALQEATGKAVLPQQARPLAPAWVKLQRLDCFSGALFPSPALLFFHVCVWGAVLIPVLGSLPNLAINLMLQKDVLDTLVWHPPRTELRRCILWFGRCVEM